MRLVRHWRRLLPLGVLAAGSLALAACSAQEPAAPQQPEAPMAPAAATTVAVGAPQQPQQPAAPQAPLALPTATPVGLAGTMDFGSRIQEAVGNPVAGGVIRVTALPIRHWDFDKPGRSTYGPSVSHDTLTHWNRSDPTNVSDRRALPELAESWEYTTDTTLVFHLRKGVKFQDLEPVNGREFVADDVVFSFNRHLSPDNPSVASLGSLSEITALDDYTVQMKFDAIYAPFMTNLSKPIYGIMAPEVLEEYGNYESFPAQIGTGPWQPNRWEKGIKIVYDKNPNYFRGVNGTGEGLPYSDRFEVLIVTDEAAKMAMYRAGQIDHGPAFYYWGFWSVLPDHLVALKDRPDLTYNYVVSGGGPYDNYQFGGKLTEAPFNNLKVRQAIALINDISCQSWCFVTGGIVPAIGLEVDNPWFVNPKDYTAEGQKFYKNWPDSTIDVTEAKRLLREGMTELGLDPAQPLKVTLTTTNYEQNLIDFSERIAADWQRDLGIDVNFVVLTSAEWTDTVVSGNFHGAFSGYDSGWVDADDFFYTRYHSASNQNRLGVNDPVLDAKIEAGRQELDPVKREAIYRDIQVYLAPLQYDWKVPNWTNANIFPNWVNNPGPQLDGDPGDMWLGVWFTPDAPSRKRPLD